ncbi:MAG: fused MFS/spermidine synthase [Chloroflexota bacterium]|nr:fused MFS/spermidine synthase [Chloroflexota bacterium]
MATLTENKRVEMTRVVPEATAGTRVTNLVLMLVVFVCGASVMTVEMSASRLLAPYFGTSLFIWANLIGLVMVYLTLGYWLGGKIADRLPRPAVLYGITAVAGLAVGLIPLLSVPILSWSLEGFAKYSVGIFYSSLVGVILLFSVPLLLLGFVSPFAIRLRSMEVSKAGGTAGSVSALSTLGSILGTFIPVFFLIPNIGTAATLYSAAFALLLFSLLGLLVSGGRRQALMTVALMLLLFGISRIPTGGIKPPAMGQLIYERESAYNYIQVVREGRKVSLMLNEGHAIHSIYDPGSVLTGGPWDYWSVAPYFNKGFSPADMKSMAMIGSAAGTAARIATRIYGAIPVDGVEIDPEIVQVGDRYFGLGEMPNVVTHEQDGRTYLQTDGKNKKWTVVGIDAYRQPYIPFHLTTVEFFQEVQRHLTPDGVVMINAGRTATDTRLVDALANTMRRVYPHVYVIDVPTMANSMVVGANETSSVSNFTRNAAGATNSDLKQVFANSLQKGNVREWLPTTQAGVFFTDDKAPVEEVIDQIILGVVGDVTKQ